MAAERKENCLSDLELDRYHAMQMEDAQIARVRAHLQSCATCRQRDDALIQEHDQIIARLRGLERS